MSQPTIRWIEVSRLSTHIRSLPVGGRCHNHPAQAFQAPARLLKCNCQIIKQFRMRWRLPLRPKILGSSNQPLPKKCGPVPIHRNSCCQWIFRIKQPCSYPKSIRWQARLQLGKAIWSRCCNFGPRVQKIPSLMNLRHTTCFFRQFLVNRRPACFKDLIFPLIQGCEPIQISFSRRAKCKDFHSIFEIAINRIQFRSLCHGRKRFEGRFIATVIVGSLIKKGVKLVIIRL